MGLLDSHDNDPPTPAASTWVTLTGGKAGTICWGDSVTMLACAPPATAAPADTCGAAITGNGTCTADDAGVVVVAQETLAARPGDA